MVIDACRQACPCSHPHPNAEELEPNQQRNSRAPQAAPNPAQQPPSGCTTHADSARSAARKGSAKSTGPRPAVSILLPVRDAADTLAICLRSIERQELTDFECVIVDDGSRDPSREIATTFARRDTRFRLVTGPRDGLVQALKRGSAACRAPLIARMDADDVMDRRRLRCQRDALEDRELAAVACHPRLFPRSALGPGMERYQGWLTSIDSPTRVREEAFVECPIAHPTLMIRHEVLAAFPYRDMNWPEDYDLVLRVLAQGHRIGIVPSPLLAWRHTETRLSRRSPQYATERFVACKAAFLAEGFLARQDTYRLWGYGGTGRAIARALRAHGKRPELIVEIHPGRIGRSIQNAPVISYTELGPPGGAPLLVSVAGLGPRTQIRNELARRGYRTGADYVCVA